MSLFFKASYFMTSEISTKKQTRGDGKTANVGGKLYAVHYTILCEK
jgi:hypothetical protein